MSSPTSAHCSPRTWSGHCTWSAQDARLVRASCIAMSAAVSQALPHGARKAFCRETLRLRRSAANIQVLVGGYLRPPFCARVRRRGSRSSPCDAILPDKAKVCTWRNASGAQAGARRALYGRRRSGPRSRCRRTRGPRRRAGLDEPAAAAAHEEEEEEAAGASFRRWCCRRRPSLRWVRAPLGAPLPCARALSLSLSPPLSLRPPSSGRRLGRCGAESRPQEPTRGAGGGPKSGPGAAAGGRGGGAREAG
eukprot:scaffold1925_cov400-Prasinococcus_capsulatus_cf.AAC.2